MDEDIAVKESSSLLVPVLISGVVGAGLALLFAPKSGHEIRQGLKRFASSAGEQASEAVETGMEKGKDIYQAGSAAAAQAAAAAKSSALSATDSERSLVVPILVSGAIGAAIALLFAPKPGSEVMSDIKDIASSAYDKSKVWYDKGAAAVKEAIEKGKQTAAETKEQLKPAA